MDPHKTAIERAFELAHTGRYEKVSEIRKAVSDEGYFQNQLTGSSLERQLRAALKTARERRV